MIRIECPYCGRRDHDEFVYVGDASRIRPPMGSETKDPEPWLRYVYLRDNPRGAHFEFWQHVHGCRAFVKVLRDTMTHEVLATGLPGETLAPEDEA